MRRKIALLLAVIMLVGIIPPIEGFALVSKETKSNTLFGFKQRKYGILFGSTNITQDVDGAPSLTPDQVAFEWAISNTGSMTYINGVYRLSYYVIDKLTGTGTKKITADIAVGDPVDSKAKVSVNVTKEDGTLEKVSYVQMQGPSGGSSGTPTEKFETTLDLSDKALYDQKELEVKIGNYSVLKLHIKQGVLQMSTTGIQNGYIVPYTLQFSSDLNTPSFVPAGKVEVFKGLNELKVLPQHLYVSTTSGAILLSKDKLSSTDDMPGSKPGVKVSFALPQTIVGNKYVPIDGSGGEFVTLTLREEFLPPGQNEIPPSKQVSFKLQDGADVYNGYELGSNSIGKISLKNNQVTIYFVQTRKDVGVDETHPIAKTLVEWPALRSGMMMQTSITFKDGAFAGITDATFRPINLGHTYIYYRASKIEGGEIAFEITPYQINGPVTYQLRFRRDGGGWVDGPSVYYANGSSKDKTLTLTTQAANTEYQIAVITGGKDDVKYIYESQILQYDPSVEASPPPLPEILSVDNLYVVPDAEKPNTEQPQAIGFDMSWRAPSARDLDTFLKDGGSLYYELNLYNADRSESMPIKVFKVSKEIDKDGKENIVVAPYGGRAGEGSYNSRQDRFTIQNIELKHKGEQGWEWISQMPKDYLRQPDYPNVDEIILEDTLDCKVPGNYYLSMRAISDPGNASGVSGSAQNLAVSQESNLHSFALDNVNEIIPTIQEMDNVSTSVDTLIAQKLIFNHVDLSRYMKYMLDPVGLTLGGDKGTKRTYEIYLYQDPNLKESNLRNPIKAVINEEGKVTLTEEQRKALREDKGVLMVEYTSEINDRNVKGNVIFNGLDANESYYVQMRVKLEPLDATTLKPISEEGRYSLFSKVHSFTTSTVPLPPTPDEQVPPAPSKFFIDEYINNTSVKMGWEPPTLDEDQKESVFYEFVRSTDMQIPAKQLNREWDIQKLLAEGSHYKGFTTVAPKHNEPYIYEYEGETLKKLEPEQFALNLRLTDTSLQPNTIYYYYVRTVEEIGGRKVASDWIMLPVTTKPVAPPIKLTVESASEHKYDSKRETVISFWAPIPPNGKVPEEYSFDIAVKGELDEDYRLDYTARLIKEEPVDSFYKRYVYKIEGLKPGMRYDIKVRIKDKTKPRPEGGDYPTSLYSEKVVFRSDFDDEEQEKDEAFEEYLKKYDQEAEKLKRKPYWKVGKEKYRSVYKYREDYLPSELGKGGTYNLIVDENASQAYFYLPASTFKTAKKYQTLLTIELEDLLIHLRPQTLTEKNEDIIKAVEQMDDKKIKDYYIGVEVLIYTSNTTINGVKPISPEITIDMELIYVDEEERLIEDDIMKELIRLIDKGRLNVIDDLEREVEKGNIQDERLDQIIQKEISDIQSKHPERVKSIMKGVVEKDREVGELDQPLLLTYKKQAHSVEAYYRNNGWESVYGMVSSQGYAVEATKLGTYIFTGKSTVAPILPDIPGAQELISKYQLTDFFGISQGQLGWYAKKSQVYGSVARVLGASRGVDYVEYLKQRGLKDVNRIGMDEVIRQDEAIYIIMQAYEKMTYKSVNQIMITNKQSVSNIGAFQPKYRQYVYASVQLGVVTPVGQKVVPSQGVTAKEVIKMLCKIVSK